MIVSGGKKFRGRFLIGLMIGCDDVKIWREIVVRLSVEIIIWREIVEVID